jgi:hypothetical protein
MRFSIYFVEKSNHKINVLLSSDHTASQTRTRGYYSKKSTEQKWTSSEITFFTTFLDKHRKKWDGKKNGKTAKPNMSTGLGGGGDWPKKFTLSSACPKNYLTKLPRSLRETRLKEKLDTQKILS